MPLSCLKSSPLIIVDLSLLVLLQPCCLLSIYFAYTIWVAILPVTSIQYLVLTGIILLVTSGPHIKLCHLMNFNGSGPIWWLDIQQQCYDPTSWSWSLWTQAQVRGRSYEVMKDKFYYPSRTCNYVLSEDVSLKDLWVTEGSNVIWRLRELL